MTEPIAQCRFRITFSKDGPLRFIGHLDLAKTWERVLRRAGAPLVYSQGFNPQPKMQIAAALPLGVSSEGELLDIWVKEPISPDGLVGQLNAVSPAGLVTLRAEVVPLRTPALQTQTVAADYRIVTDEVDEEELRRRVDDLLAQERLDRERRGKSYNLRPLIFQLEVMAANELRARLALGEQGTARPDELLSALGLSLNRARCHRLRLHLRAQPGASEFESE